jgi:hypothetical protein
MSGGGSAIGITAAVLSGGAQRAFGDETGFADGDAHDIPHYGGAADRVLASNSEGVSHVAADGGRTAASALSSGALDSSDGLGDRVGAALINAAGEVSLNSMQVHATTGPIRLPLCIYVHTKHERICKYNFWSFISEDWCKTRCQKRDDVAVLLHSQTDLVGIKIHLWHILKLFVPWYPKSFDFIVSLLLSLDLIHRVTRKTAFEESQKRNGVDSSEEDVPLHLWVAHKNRYSWNPRISTYFPRRQIIVPQKGLVTVKSSYVVKRKGRGFGVICGEDLEVGDIAAVYCGELKREVLSRANTSRSEGTHYLSLSRDLIIDGSLHGRFDTDFFIQNGSGSFFNSSSDYNCVLRVYPRNIDTSSHCYELLEAGREIAISNLIVVLLEVEKKMSAGTEMFWNYRTESPRNESPVSSQESTTSSQAWNPCWRRIWSSRRNTCSFGKPYIPACATSIRKTPSLNHIHH